MKLETTGIKRKNPINRNNFFTSSDCIDFQLGMGMEYVNKVLNQTVVLYEVDLDKTKVNDTYQEADFSDIIFKTPVEINVMYDLEDSDLKAYDSSKAKGMFKQAGKLNFQVYQKELEENDCDIKRGDYIGLQVTPEHMEFFIVTDDGRVNYGNKRTMWGTVPYYRSVKCAVVSDITETVNL